MYVLDSDTLRAVDAAAAAVGRRTLHEDDRARLDPDGRHILSGIGEADMDGWHLGRMLIKRADELDPTEVFVAVRSSVIATLPTVIDSLRGA